MTIDPLVFFDLVIALFVLAIALATMAISYSQMLKKFNAYQKEADELMAQVHKNEADLLETARIKAGKIVEEANKRELESLKQKNIDIVKNVSKDIEEDTVKDVEDFDNILQKETFAAQKIVEDKLEKEYSNVQQNRQDYKNEMLKKAEEEIYKILETVSKLTLGKSIPLADHEQLIIEALEKAKKDGIAK